MDFNEIEVRAVCQFFNIPNASLDDMRFLLQMGFGSNRGLEYHQAFSREVGWKCQAAIDAVRLFAFGKPRSQNTITSEIGVATEPVQKDSHQEKVTVCVI